MMENRTSQLKEEPEIELSAKEKVLEIVAVGMCFLLLLACFLKVMFF
ncbi:MAG: hypothetical protein HY842_18765 [Bacteroidetes bacterium]|nr:hypothetical protein [Bacteroidota bacterium]